MAHLSGSRTCRVLALIWSATVAIYLVVVSVAIIRDTNFPLNFGTIRTVGRAGLWITLLPGLLGLIAIPLVLMRERLGTWLLGTFSLFWAGVLISALPRIWNAPRTFCMRTFCISTPWISRLLVFGLMTPFLLAALWSEREAVRDTQRIRLAK